MRRIAHLSLLVGLLTIGFLLVTAHGTLNFMGRPLGTDFSQVYAAGRMVLDGDAADVWTWSKHFAVQMQVHHATHLEVCGWHYPPPFLLKKAEQEPGLRDGAGRCGKRLSTASR